MIIVSYFLLPIQVPPRLRLFCPLANSTLTFGSIGSSWQSSVKNIMEKWLTWWFQGDYRFKENNPVDGMGRRIPPGAAGAKQILNSVIVGFPIVQHIFFLQCCRGWGKASGISLGCTWYTCDEDAPAKSGTFSALNRLQAVFTWQVLLLLCVLRRLPG